MASLNPTRTAVVLAAGRGTRLRKADPTVRLTGEQIRIADTGFKALIPINGRPFLDYVLSAVADAGFERIGIVIGPDHGALREHYEDLRPRRIALEFIEQKEPLGGADAVRRAESFVASEPFLVINGDNYYPADVLALIHQLEDCGLVGFRRDTLVRGGNMTLAGTMNCAHIELSSDGELVGLHEKPGADHLGRLSRPRAADLAHG